MELSLSKSDWDNRLQQLISSHAVFAPVINRSNLDYSLLDTEAIPEIVYNQAKPASPLKTFFLPVKENVTDSGSPDKPLAILGAPPCDVEALKLLDAIYLDEEFPDPSYAERRKNCTLISMDCHSIQEHCHCTSCGIDPGGGSGADISLAVAGDRVILRKHSEKGGELLESMGILVEESPTKEESKILEEKINEVKKQLESQNSGLPSYEESGKLVSEAGEEVWRKFASTCVSCGACSAICPTCTCFLLLDRPGFEKVRQLDTCQYPGFERVAGGEDPLHALADRFRNRYMCKYVWKPDKYSLKACTGCGRCTEGCIGLISKNELIQSLSN